MEPIDGLYRYRGATITWDGDGVSLTDDVRKRTTRARWDEIIGARQVGLGPGYVQLLVRGHEPASNYYDDPYAFAVNSDPDAHRLVTSIGWHAAAPGHSLRAGNGWRDRLLARIGQPRTGASCPGDQPSSRSTQRLARQAPR